MHLIHVNTLYEMHTWQMVKIEEEPLQKCFNGQNWVSQHFSSRNVLSCVALSLVNFNNNKKNLYNHKTWDHYVVFTFSNRFLTNIIEYIFSLLHVADRNWNYSKFVLILNKWWDAATFFSVEIQTSGLGAHYMSSNWQQSWSKEMGEHWNVTSLVQLKF